MRSYLINLGYSVLLMLILFNGCSNTNTPTAGEDPIPPDPNTEFEAVGTASTLDMATWNLEWFGDASRGPSDDDRQLRNVDFVISGLDMDIWSIQEVTDTGDFNTLLDSLDGYDGFLANDASVAQGPEFYNDFGGNEQKVGLIYKSELVSVNSSRIILTENDNDFAGRPPLEVEITVTLGGTSLDMVVILVHAKCCSDLDSWTRRSNASEALKNYLDTTWPNAPVVVIGDFNDDLDESIYSGQASPYLNFLQDDLDYTFPTLELTEAGVSSTVSYPDIVDHHLNSNEMYLLYEMNSAQAFQADDYVVNYAETTSDHYPVLSRYTLTAN